MPGHLQALTAAAAIGAVLGALGGCKARPAGGAAASSAAPLSAASAVPAARTSTERWALAEAARAREAEQAFSRALAARSDELRPRYLALREAIASLEPIARAYSKMGIVVLVGPERSSNEVGGALLLLDGALDEKDWEAASEQAAQLERSVSIVEAELSRARFAPVTVATTLSNAAYTLGLALVEATATVPSQDDAALADARGLLAGIERGSAAFTRDHAPTEASRARLARALAPLRTALDGGGAALPDGRAALVHATAELGVALRGVARDAHVSVALPYPARRPTRDNGWDESVSAFTMPAERRAATANDPRLAELGRRLFSDQRLSGKGDRSCATCHVPSDWFTERRPIARSLDPKVRLRNTPTLLYVPVQAAMLWDGRLSAVSAQAIGVMFSHAEMALSPELLSERLSRAAEYAELADESGVVTPAQVASALAAFQDSVMVPANAPLDTFARGETDALDTEEQRGFDLFAGKGRCARCHIPPTFGGSRPLDFATPVYAALGVPEQKGGAHIDPDRGRITYSRLPSNAFAFKTPTVRNIGRTAPYFHNGSYANLHDVLVFYNDGGGKALGYDVPSQDPEVRPLHLTDSELAAVEVFITRALADELIPTALMKSRP